VIFLSHTHADKPLVDQIARQLAAAFGQDQIFYDSWSIQPGEGIIERMNVGLTDCKVFFFFVSKKSLQSEMVKLEWQNALLKATKGQTRIVPVRLDDVLMPAVLLQTLYIDVFGQGLETAIRQMVDVATGRNTYTSAPQQTFENVRAYVTQTPSKITVEFRAEAYLEPQSRYLVLVDNPQDDLTFGAVGEDSFFSAFQPQMQLSTGATVNAILVARDRATSPGFPFIAEVTTLSGKPVLFRGAMRIATRDQFKAIPAIAIPAT
jgi:hypothetical protein